MRFLLDENVSVAVSNMVRGMGFECDRANDILPEGTIDQDIYALICEREYILVTRDFHFTNPVRFPAEKTPGIIFIRHGNLTSQEEATLVKEALTALEPEAIKGHLVIVSRDRITIR